MKVRFVNVITSSDNEMSAPKGIVRRDLLTLVPVKKTKSLSIAEPFQTGCANCIIS